MMRGTGAAASAGAPSAAATTASANGGTAGFSAEDLERARASFRILLETACCLLPAAEITQQGAAAASAGGGLQTSVLLLLTRLCEEGWAPDLLAEMILAAEDHRNQYLTRVVGDTDSPQWVELTLLPSSGCFFDESI
ncbi:hypothetical protein Esti_003970 [Eimeria stiedai]